MSERLIATPGPILESIEETQDDKGSRTTYVYTGTEAEVKSQRILERQRGAKFLQIKPAGGGKWELNASFPFTVEEGNGDAEVPTDTHELETTMAQQDIFLCPKLIAKISDEADRHLLLDLVKRYKQSDPAFNTVTKALAQVGAETGGNEDMLDYFKLIALKGVEHWIFYRSVYSRTITSATPRQVQASFEGSQKIWTTAQLQAWEGLPTDWWFQLPPNAKWHKSPPTVTTNIGRGRKTQINYKYLASDEISPLVYDNY